MRGRGQEYGLVRGKGRKKGEGGKENEEARKIAKLSFFKFCSEKNGATRSSSAATREETAHKNRQTRASARCCSWHLPGVST